MTPIRHLIAAILLAGATALTAAANGPPQADETRVEVPGARLYVRSIGSGPVAIVLHGGPDFDSAYLLPDMDRLSDTLRLVYYDQRGRGRSATGVHAEDVTLASDVADLDAVRRAARAPAAILIGHSWGTVLALEYALRHPEAVARLVLMNPAPMSAADLARMREYYLAKLGDAMPRQREIAGGDAYRSGDPDAVVARYRIHFRPAFATSAAYETLMQRMSAAFHEQGARGILLARAVEDRLYLDTWDLPDYNLAPRLAALPVPTLVVFGEEDFIPLLVSEHVAAAVPGAKLVRIPHCGHFSYLECPRELQAAVAGFLARTTPPEKR